MGLDKKRTDVRDSFATYIQNYCNRLFLTMGEAIVIGRGKIAIKGKGLSNHIHCMTTGA